VLDHLTRTHVPLGRISRVPVGLNASWFAVFALVVWTLGRGYFPQVAPGAGAGAVWGAALAGALLFFGSILAHELGHALCALACGIEVKGITLFLLGGVSRIASEPRDAGEELRIAIAGPAVSVALSLIAGVAAFLTTGSPLGNALAIYLVLVNAALAVFNMIPALPLDGGRVLRAILWRTSGDALRATRWSATAGRFCGLSMIALGAISGVFGALVYGFWFVLIGVFIDRSAKGSARAAEESAAEALKETVRVLGTDAMSEHDYRHLLERIVMWRARLDALPRPAEVSDDAGGDEDAIETGRRFVDDRMEMYRLLNEIDVDVRSRLSQNGIEEKLGRLAGIYLGWSGPSARQEEAPEDSLLAGRPERYAPSPEEALTHEPGSSVEVDAS
jgi:Zn-dependent protease